MPGNTITDDKCIGPNTVNNVIEETSDDLEKIVQGKKTDQNSDKTNVKEDEHENKKYCEDEGQLSTNLSGMSQDEERKEIHGGSIEGNLHDNYTIKVKSRQRRLKKKHRTRVSKEVKFILETMSQTKASSDQKKESRKKKTVLSDKWGEWVSEMPEITDLTIPEIEGKEENYNMNDRCITTFVDACSLHVTFPVFSVDKDEILNVYTALKESLTKLKQVYCDLTSKSIDFNTLDTFQDEVVFMAVKESKGFEFLQSIFKVLSDSLIKQNILLERNTFTPHATVMKMKRKVSLTKKGIKKFPLELYSAFKDEFFWEEELHEIFLCDMNKKPGKFYGVLATLDLKHNKLIMNEECKDVFEITEELLDVVICKIERREKNDEIMYRYNADVVQNVLLDIIGKVEENLSFIHHL